MYKVQFLTDSLLLSTSRYITYIFFKYLITHRYFRIWLLDLQVQGGWLELLIMYYCYARQAKQYKKRQLVFVSQGTEISYERFLILFLLQLHVCTCTYMLSRRNFPDKETSGINLRAHQGVHIYTRYLWNALPPSDWFLLVGQLF